MSMLGALLAACLGDCHVHGIKRRLQAGKALHEEVESLVLIPLLVLLGLGEVRLLVLWHLGCDLTGQKDDAEKDYEHPGHSGPPETIE